MAGILTLTTVIIRITFRTNSKVMKKTIELILLETSDTSFTITDKSLRLPLLLCIEEFKILMGQQ